MMDIADLAASTDNSYVAVENERVNLKQTLIERVDDTMAESAAFQATSKLHCYSCFLPCSNLFMKLNFQFK